jgi:putative ABC transport system substrate-binding protein
MSRRRQLVLAAGLAPFAGLAQPAQRMRRIGSLSLSKANNEVAKIGRSMTRESLRRAGWEEGKNLVIERRYAEGDVDRLDHLANELVSLNVELIIATLNAPIEAAKRATNNIPIVMLGVVEPIENGFVQTLAHPGGNLTGTTAPGPETAAKSIQILREVAPSLTRLAILFNPTNPAMRPFNETRIRAANSLDMTVKLYPVTQPDDFTAALEQIVVRKAQMLVVNGDGVIESRFREITTFAIEHKILSIGVVTLFTSVGGALYYGSNLQEIIDRTVSFIDRILLGAKPGDLPVEEPTNFDLIINMKTMRAIGISAPRSVLVRATEVIE